MSSGDKGHLGSLFDDFEFEPSAEVWDGIAAGSPQPGELTETFSDFNHPPHPRVWRRVVQQLYPARRRRAVVWWSSAAGIALLLGVFLSWPKASDPAGLSGRSLANNEVSPELRRIHDAEQWSGRDLGALPQNHDFTAALCAEGDAATRLALTSGYTFDWEGWEFPIYDPFEAFYPHYSPMPSDQYFLPHSFGNLEEFPLLNNLQAFGQKGVNHVQPLVSRTPDLLTMEDTQLNLIPSFVDMADIKRKRRPLEAKLGGQLAATNGVVLNGVGTDVAFNQVSHGHGFVLAAEDLSDSRKDGETYQTPILLGFALQKYFTEKWSYLPGIVYTRLNSSFENINESSQPRYTRQRDYFGIQIGLQRDLIHKKNHLIYASTNFTEELAVRGNTKRYNASGLVSETSFRPPHQSSIALGMGARFFLGDRLSLYAEGSAVTYSPTSLNLFNRKVIWPRLQVGLNLTL